MCVPRRIRLFEEDDALLVPASYCNTTFPLPGHPMEANQAVVVATGAFFNPVVLLFLSGFAMSRVMDTYEISRCVLALHDTMPPVSWWSGCCPAIVRLLCGCML